MSSALANAVFWIAAASCLVAQSALIVSAIRSPMRGSAESASIAMPRRAGEIAWTIVPAIGLAVLLLFTWRAINTPSSAPDPHAAHGGANRG